MYEKKRARRWLARERQDAGSPSFVRRKTTTFSCERRTKRWKKTRAGVREDGGPYGNFLLLRETVMHVSPISLTKRLLATFCPRDNSLSSFMAAPISQLKNYSQEVATHFGTWTDTKVFKSTYRMHLVTKWSIISKYSMMRLSINFPLIIRKIDLKFFAILMQRYNAHAEN